MKNFQYLCTRFQNNPPFAHDRYQKHGNDTDSTRTRVGGESDVKAPQKPVTYYALQVCASRAPLDASDPKLKGVACESRKIGDWYKYYAIINTDRNKVVEKQQELKKIFPDCWITKWSE